MRLLPALVIALTLGACTATPASTPANAPAGPSTLAACENEDGPGPCRWDAATRGNHRGESFWLDAQGTAHYPDPASDPDWAQRHQAQGWVPLGRDVDGHKDCLILVGDTSYLACPDGFRTES